jgi:mannose/fructose-specific phosphotransferase system component IIA
MIRAVLAAAIAAGLALPMASDAMAKGRAKKSAQPACLNALACGPQPVKQIRKPKNEKFLRSAS